MAGGPLSRPALGAGPQQPTAHYLRRAQQSASANSTLARSESTENKKDWRRWHSAGASPAIIMAASNRPPTPPPARCYTTGNSRSSPLPSPTIIVSPLPSSSPQHTQQAVSLPHPSLPTTEAEASASRPIPIPVSGRRREQEEDRRTPANPLPFRDFTPQSLAFTHRHCVGKQGNTFHHNPTVLAPELLSPSFRPFSRRGPPSDASSENDYPSMPNVDSFSPDRPKTTSASDRTAENITERLARQSLHRPSTAPLDMPPNKSGRPEQSQISRAPTSPLAHMAPPPRPNASSTGRRAAPKLQLQGLPRFHPAVYQSPSSSAVNSPSRARGADSRTPLSPQAQQRQRSIPQNRLQQYQREVIATATATANANAAAVRGGITPLGRDTPRAPALAPCMSPGPATPLALEDSGDYLTSTMLGPGSPRELVDRMIRDERDRRHGGGSAHSSPAVSPAA